MSVQPDERFTVTVLAAPRGRSALVCLSGEIDMAATIVLSQAVDRLAAVAPTTVVVDLGNVTFAGSTLPNFIVLVHQRLPVSSTLLLCRPVVAVERLLHMTDMEQFCAVRDELPCRPRAARYRSRPGDDSESRRTRRLTMLP